MSIFFLYSKNHPFSKTESTKIPPKEKHFGYSLIVQ